MKKVITRLVGGMGNQLFNYAMAKRLALVNDAELVLDDVSGFAYDIHYNRTYQLHHFNINARKATALERLEPCSRLRRYLKRKYNSYLPIASRTYIREEGIGFDDRLLHYKIKNDVYLEGIWQSESYFRDIAETIRHDLSVIPPSDEKNLAVAKEIQKSTSVMMHFRFHDERHIAKSDALTPDYYSLAIKYMNQLVPNAHYFVFSDKPLDVRTWIALDNMKVTYVSHNQDDAISYADLWLMSQCKHFIIANSTFSWWGAWLASNQDKIVIAPNVRLRARNPNWSGLEGVLPQEWIKL